MSKLITEGFVKKFERLVKKAHRLQVASAWLTDNDGFRAVLARESSGFKIQAIIGTYGEATDPRSLEEVVKEFGTESLRIADTNPLFHQKLYIFHGPGSKTTAWIGSMNFTKGGMRSNSEIILEVENSCAVEEMVAWFEHLWTKLEEQDVYERITQYRSKWDRRDKKSPIYTVAEGIEEIVVQTTGKQGRVFVGKIKQGRESEDWKGHPELCAKLLARLAGGEDEFFRELETCDEFSVNVRDSSSEQQHLIYLAGDQATAQDNLYVKGGNDQNSVRPIVESESGKAVWWLGTSTSKGKLWKLVEVATEVHNERHPENQIYVNKPLSITR